MESTSRDGRHLHKLKKNQAANARETRLERIAATKARLDAARKAKQVKNWKSTKNQFLSNFYSISGRESVRNRTRSDRHYGRRTREHSPGYYGCSTLPTWSGIGCKENLKLGVYNFGFLQAPFIEPPAIQLPARVSANKTPTFYRANERSGMINLNFKLRIIIF